mmetsp:Transcript_2495/g.3452  ORF Transcript_2495/g.3452 Transcript_2495/m.3452 type:complete len:244 (-) Transcript_2495:465-1196(-)
MHGLILFFLLERGALPTAGPRKFIHYAPQRALTSVEGLIGLGVTLLLDKQLLKFDFLNHALVPLELSLCVLRAPLRNRVALVLHEPVRQIQALAILHQHRVTLLLPPVLPFFEAFHGESLLVGDLLFFVFLLLLELLVDLGFFLKGLLFALLGKLSDLGGHLVPPLQLPRRPLNLKCQHLLVAGLVRSVGRDAGESRLHRLNLHKFVCLVADRGGYHTLPELVVQSCHALIWAQLATRGQVLD